MSLRILADDLTGALDSAARTVGAFGPLPVYWTTPATPTGAFVFDSGTREANRDTAVEAVRRIAPLLRGDNVAFKKIDSLFRGNTAAEIAAAVEGRFEAAIIAPAFPDQGRRTRDGRQWIVSADGAETCVPVDLAAELAALGHRVSLCRPGDRVPAGLSLWDAQTNADLAAIVGAGHKLAHPPLWCGTAGLAGALAGFETPTRQPFAEPLLGIFGSDSTVSRRQLAALGSRVRRATPPFAPAIYDLTPNEPTMLRDEAARRITARDGAALRRPSTPSESARLRRRDVARLVRNPRCRPSGGRWRVRARRADVGSRRWQMGWRPHPVEIWRLRRSGPAAPDRRCRAAAPGRM